DPGVDDERLRPPAAGVLLRHLDGRAAHGAAREDRGHGAGPVRGEQRDIELAFAGRLDPGVHGASAKASRRGDRAVLDARDRGRFGGRELHYGNSGSCRRPAVSSRPSIRFMHCTTLPAAPFPRLSSAEKTITVPVPGWIAGWTTQ